MCSWCCHCRPQVCWFYRRVTSLDAKRGVCPCAGIRLRRVVFWGRIFWHWRRGRGGRRRYEAPDETRVREHSVGDKREKNCCYCCLSERWLETSCPRPLCKRPDWLSDVLWFKKTLDCHFSHRTITGRTVWSDLLSAWKNFTVMWFQRLCTEARSLLFREQRLVLKLRLQIRWNSVIVVKSKACELVTGCW